MTKRLNLLELKNLLSSIDNGLLEKFSICADLGFEGPEGKFCFAWAGDEAEESVCNILFDTEEYKKIKEGLINHLNSDWKKIATVHLDKEGTIAESICEMYSENELDW